MSGTANMRTVAAVCVFRTHEAPVRAPLPDLQVQRGLQKPLLTALDATSVDRLLADPAPLPGGLLDHVDWPVNVANSLLAEQTHL